MKKVISKFTLIAALLILLATVTVPYAARFSYQPSGPAEGVDSGAALLSSQIEWIRLASAASGGAEPADIDGADRTFVRLASSVANSVSGYDKVAVTRIPASWNNVRFRSVAIAENATITYQIYLGTLGSGTDCTLAKFAQLAFVIGTASSTIGSHLLADTLVVTVNDWLGATSTSSPANDRVAEVSVNCLGADVIAIIPTVVSADSYLLIKGY